MERDINTGLELGHKGQSSLMILFQSLAASQTIPLCGDIYKLEVKNCVCYNNFSDTWCAARIDFSAIVQSFYSKRLSIHWGKWNNRNNL